MNREVRLDLPVLSLLLLSFSTGWVLAAGNDPGVPSDWWSGVQQSIRDMEYEITWQDRTVLPDLDEAWYAPNRAHNFRTYFTPDGIKVLPRIQGAHDDHSWRWGLVLLGFGRGEDLEPTSAAALSAEGNQITYDRGDVIEWYVNTPEGLKQSFSIAGSSSHRGSNGSPDPSYLALALHGDLSPFISTDGQAIDFRSSDGVTMVRYAQLQVRDATGAQIRAWMEGFNEAGVGGIRLMLDDRNAVYPLTIDPLVTSPAWTAESDQDGALYGIAVATAGDVNGDGYSDVIVGASQYDDGQTDEGRVYVYHGSPSGLSASAAWMAESNQAGALFGVAVATAGDVNGDGYSDVIVGADFYDGEQSDEGGVFVYYGSSSGIAGAPWTAESDQPDAHFGRAVSTAGDVDGDGYSDIVVGALDYDSGQVDEGRVYVYHGSSSGLSGTPWTAESDQESARFGVSVSTAGDVNGDSYSDVIVGAYWYDNGETDEGRAYVYFGSASGLSGAPWIAESDHGAALFGRSVSTAGDVNGDGFADVIVGAHWYDNGEAFEGRVFAYHGSASGLATTPSWTAEGDQVEAYFGVSVASAGDVNGDGYADVIVGAFRFNDVEADEGHAFVYYGTSTGLAVDPVWTGQVDQASAEFGQAVAPAGDVNGDGYADVIVGAPLYDNGEAEEGRAFVFHGGPAGLATYETWTAEGDQTDTFLGGVSAAGDVNGDGYADVLVAAGGSVDTVFAYYGSPSGLPTAPDWQVQQIDSIGLNFSTAGDVNGDGYSDVIIADSSYAWQLSWPGHGIAYVYLGSASGLSPSFAWTQEGDQEGARFGSSVSTAGDVNGDGYSDVVVGASRYDSDPAHEDSGRVYVYHGSANGLSTRPAWVKDGKNWYWFGSTVSTAGDVNGDGYSDVIIAELDMEYVYVFHGSASGLEQDHAWSARDQHTGTNWFGDDVSTAGDVNGDGYGDIIVGASHDDGPPDSDGWVYVWHGSPTGLTGDPWEAYGFGPTREFGKSVSTAGDVNGDGYADIIVGAPGDTQYDAGTVFVYYGSASGLTSGEQTGAWPYAGWKVRMNQTYDRFGSSVSTVGDVNGDGYAEVLVGAARFDNGEEDEGMVFLYEGNEGAGLSLTPRQWRADDMAPITSLCLTRSADSFRLKLRGRTPFGRGDVALEWEAKPFGAPFDGLGTGVGTSYDTGTAGVELSEQVTGLLDDTQYHWRVRLRYDPVTTPFAQHSRWLTVPWNGWQEADLLSGDPTGAGRVPDQPDWTGKPLTITKVAGSDITLDWDPSCLSGDADYAIYEGTLDQFYSHDSRFCTTAGATTKTFTPAAGLTYYLVVPLNATREGSYGTGSSGVERPAGGWPCLPHEVGDCD